jgi:hypothetical protein
LDLLRSHSDWPEKNIIGHFHFLSTDIVLRASHYNGGKNERVLGIWFITVSVKSPLEQF